MEFLNQVFLFINFCISFLEKTFWVEYLLIAKVMWYINKEVYNFFKSINWLVTKLIKTHEKTKMMLTLVSGLEILC